MRGALALLAMSLAAAAGGPSAPGAAAASRSATTDAQVRADLNLPARVPLRATGRAPAAGASVVRTWFSRLRHGE